MLALVSLALGALTLAQGSILQPKSYASPSGGWTLSVVPGERSGTKDAEYTLTGGEREAWRRRHPFALWEAVVTDDGRVAGYAYAGKTIDAPEGGTLRVIVLSPAGDVVLDEAHEREMSRAMQSTGIPRALGIFAQPELGRFIVRVSRDDWEAGEEWWAYELAGGKPLSQEHPKLKLALSNSPLLAVRAIPGTPLVLLNQIYSTVPRELGGSFRLVDEHWKVVWERVLPRDFEAGGDEDEQDRLLDALYADGAVLATAPQRFDLRFVAEGARVTFGVERDGEAWKVTELARMPYQAQAIAAPTEIPTRTLTLSRRVPLGAPPAPGAEIRDIYAFGFDERSQLRFVRGEAEKGAVSLVLLDANGSVLRATPVAADEGEGSSEWFPLPLERWLAVSETYDGQPARLRLVREADGSASEVPGFSGQEVKCLTALGPESFVLLGTWHSRYTMTDGLVAFDLAGRVLWTVDEDLEDEQKLFSAQDVAVTSDGRVVVLENIRNVLQVYSSKGEYLQTVELETVWGHEPNYPSGIRADRDGGVLIHDFNGTPPLYRMNRQGEVTTSFDIRRKDGTTLEEYRRFVQLAPDGRLWTTDRHEFLRLDDAGRVDLQLGSAERLDELADPGFACVESLFGRVLIHDERTRAVHVFDGEGRRVTLCRPKPEEREKLRFPMGLSVAPDGSIHVADGRYDARPLRFSAAGVSEGFQDAEAVNIAFAPSGGDYLGVRDAGIERVSAERKPLARLDKRPDGRWFRDIGDIAVAGDGALAVLDGPLRGNPWVSVPPTGDDEGLCIALFTPSAEPVGLLHVPGGIPGGMLAYQGGHLLLNNWESAWLIDPRDGTTTALSIAEPAHAFGLSPDGSELWAVAKDGRSLLRYALAP